MIYGLVLVVHVLVSLVLIAVILLQGGRGGLSDALGGAAAQSLFGGGATTVLTRITTFCAAMFVVTCLSLAYLSTVRGRSVIEQVPLINPGQLPAIPGVLPFPATAQPASPETNVQTEQPSQPPQAQAPTPAHETPSSP